MLDVTFNGLCVKMDLDSVDTDVRRSLGLMHLFELVAQLRLKVFPGRAETPQLTSEGDAFFETENFVEQISPPTLSAPPPTEPIVKLMDVASQTRSTDLPSRMQETTPVFKQSSAQLQSQTVVEKSGATIQSNSQFTNEELQPLADIEAELEFTSSGQRFFDVTQINLLNDRDGVDADDVDPEGLEDLFALAGVAEMYLDGSLEPNSQVIEVSSGYAPLGDAVDQDASNLMLNQTLTYSDDVGIGTLVVMGDAHLATSIAQINLATSETASGGTFLTETALSNSIVEFSGYENDVRAQDSSDRNPVELKLEIIDGDFLHVDIIRQLQAVDDRDTYASVVGRNTQVEGNRTVNEIYLDSDVETAELLIVAGDYISVRSVTQVNLMDASSPEAGSLHSLGNEVQIWGDAQVDFAPVTKELQEVADSAFSASGWTSPDLSRFDHDQDGVVEALYVTGNYYNVKSIEQKNALADRDVRLADIASAVSIDTTANVNTDLSNAEASGNRLGNLAVIDSVTPNALESFIGGDVYNTEHLLNIDLLVRRDSARPESGSKTDLPIGREIEDFSELFVSGGAMESPFDSSGAIF